MTTGTGITVELRGAFFNDVKRRSIIDNAVSQAIHEVVLTGEGLVKEQLFRPANFPITRHGKVTGHLQRSVQGTVISKTNGQIDDGGVVYGPWIEGVSTRNDASRFKGYGMFRRTKTLLDKRAPQILEKRVRKAVAELNRAV